LGSNHGLGGLTFVPAGLPGAGEMKLNSYNFNDTYTVALSADGSGTYDVTSVTPGVTLANVSNPNPGPEGMVYVPPGAPLFPLPSVLISEFNNGDVAAYAVDINGDPIVATRQPFITNIDSVGTEGAAVDPLTGDFLFSSAGTSFNDHVILVRGHGVPEPSSLVLAVLGLASALLGWVRRGR
jgi:PEP-CTERM motif-containing protein